MSLNRRDFIQAGTAASLLDGARLAGPRPPTHRRSGLIFPPANYPIPPDAGRLYPSGVRFIGNGLGFNGMTIESYNEAIPRAMPRAQELAAQGANLISVFGSSITFYKGAAFNKELTDKVTELTGLPATTQSNGLVDGLKHVNASASPSRRRTRTSSPSGCKSSSPSTASRSMSTKGLGYERVPEGGGHARDSAQARRRSARGRRQSRTRSCMSCGGLRTLDVIVPLENAISVPVVSSTPHGLWHCARMLGVKNRIEGFGMVMAA